MLFRSGNGNMMNILDHGIHICQMMSFDEIDNALDLITINGYLPVQRGGSGLSDVRRI